MKSSHPRAYQWHDVWTEFRPRSIARKGGFNYEADFVTIWRNRRTRKQTELVQFRGTGPDLPFVVLDLLLQAEPQLDGAEREAACFRTNDRMFPMVAMFHIDRKQADIYMWN